MPLITLSQLKKSSALWWIPLGALVFLAGALGAIWFTDGRLPSINLLPIKVAAIGIDPEAAEPYAETIKPPPSDIVVPVPVMPAWSAPPQAGDNLNTMSAGIALPVSSAQVPDPGAAMTAPKPDADPVAAAAVAVAADALTPPNNAAANTDAAQIAMRETDAPADDSLLDSAQEKLDAGDDQKALAIYNHILANNGASRPALAGKAFTLQHLGRFEQAAAVERRLLRLDPRNDATRVNYAMVLGAWGSSEAVKELQHMAATKPDFAPAQAALALALTRSGDALQALPHARRAIQADPENMFYRLNLAVVYDKLGHSGEAADLYRQVLQTFDTGGDIPPGLPNSPESIQKRVDYLQGLMASADKMAAEQD